MSQNAGMTRVAIVMAGGSGERFWPLSRLHRPKQLLCLTEPHRTMLEEAVLRLTPVLPPDHIFVVTARHLVEPIRSANTGIPAENVVAEPCKRNTTGALAYATATILARFGDIENNLSAAVVTADHHIGESDRFSQAVSTILDAVEREDVLGVMGITPTRPETGYGYIQSGKPLAFSSAGDVPLFMVRAFHEKPNEEQAEDFIATGRYYWNSGMFFWKISTFLREMDAAIPGIASMIRDMATELRKGNKDSVDSIFDQIDDVSIDYALMEHARRVIMVHADFPWDDIGSWPALTRVHTKDSSGNVAIGDPVLLGAKNCVVYNELGAERIAVAVVGVEDLVVVVTQDGVLVTPKNRAQDVRYAVTELKRRGAKQV